MTRFHLLSALFSACLFFSLPFTTKAQETAEDLFNTGKALHLDGKLDECVLWYEKALEVQPDHEGAAFNLSAAYFSRQKFQKSLNVLDRYLELHPDDMEAMERKANCFFRLKDYLMAASTLTEILMNQPEARLYTIRGLAYFENRDYEVAALDFDLALGLDSMYADAWIGKGQCYVEFHEFEAAEQVLRYAHALGSAEAELDYILAVALFRQGKTDDALQTIKRYNTTQTSAKGLALAALCHLQRNEMEPAQKLLETAHKMAISVPETHAADGQLALKQEKYGEALESFSEALLLRQRDETLLFNRAQAHYLLAAYRAALNDLDDALLILPDYGDALALRANCKYMLGDAGGACNDFIKAQGLGYTPAPDEDRMIFCK